MNLYIQDFNFVRFKSDSFTKNDPYTIVLLQWHEEFLVCQEYQICNISNTFSFSSNIPNVLPFSKCFINWRTRWCRCYGCHILQLNNKKRYQSGKLTQPCKAVLQENNHTFATLAAQAKGRKRWGTAAVANSTPAPNSIRRSPANRSYNIWLS